MSEEKYDQPISGHSYDGIEELDNPLPRWWRILFILTVIYGIGYYGYYEFMGGPSSDQELSVRMAKIETLKAKAEKKKPSPQNVDYAAILADTERLAKGKEQYVQKCAACHADKGQGLIGPNLTDRHWMHGKGKVADIVELIEVGVPAKGMPPWKGVIPDKDIISVAAYIKSLKDSNPAGAKPPQGELVED